MVQLERACALCHGRTTGGSTSRDHSLQKVLKVERKVKLRVQPKLGGLAHKAAVVLDLADWSESSRKQTPACYTNARHQASRCETDVA